MSEGGRFPWKMQKQVLVPVANYTSLKEPLPAPPSGMRWQLQGKDWRLVEDTPEEEDEEWELLSEDQVSLQKEQQRQLSGGDSSASAATEFNYIEHVVLPEDTLQGILLRYKITATALRQANRFSGHNLQLAPKKLVIPVDKTKGCVRRQDTQAKEYKLHAFLADFPDMSAIEAKAYLELADWELADAVQSASQDLEWERTEAQSGNIRITVDKAGRLVATGAGLQKKRTVVQDDDEEDDRAEKVVVRAKPVKVTPERELPSIATKSLKAQDAYEAAPQHDNFGVELQSFKEQGLT